MSMQEYTELTGIVLAVYPVKEYDKRFEFLSKERGRITIFATGARRQNSPLSAATTPFAFGTYKVYEGRNSFSLREAKVENLFEDISLDFDKMCYASYFAEMTRYFTRENVDAFEELKLLYVAFRAIERGKVPLPVIRIAFELKMIQAQGEGMEFFHCLSCGAEGKEVNAVYFSEGGLLCKNCVKKMRKDEKPFILSSSAKYTIQFVLSTPCEKLFSFTLSERVQEEIFIFLKRYLRRYVDVKFHSLEFIEGETCNL